MSKIFITINVPEKEARVLGSEKCWVLKNKSYLYLEELVFGRARLSFFFFFGPSQKVKHWVLTADYSSSLYSSEPLKRPAHLTWPFIPAFRKFGVNFAVFCDSTEYNWQQCEALRDLINSVKQEKYSILFS